MNARSITRAALLLLALIAGSVGAQVTLPSPSPNLQLKNAGWVNAMVRQADGGVIVAGDFSSINGVARGNIARLRPDGTLDLEWAPMVDASISEIAPDPNSGALYLTGQFYSINGQSRRGIAKLSADGALDTRWTSPLDAFSNETPVQAVAVGGDGAVYVGGNFAIGGNPVRLVKLSGLTGARDAGWNAAPIPNDWVFELAVRGNDLFAGGRFTRIGDTPRQRLARLSIEDGRVLGGWDRAVDGGDVLQMDFTAAGELYLSGTFLRIDQVSRGFAAKLDTSGALSPNWSINANGLIMEMRPLEDGSVQIGGRFSTMNGHAREKLARVSGDTGTILPWSNVSNAIPSVNAGGSGAISAIEAVGDDGRILVGGEFIRADQHSRLGLATLDGNGNFGAPIDAEETALVQAIASQSNGAVIVGGQFITVNGQPQQGLLRLRPDGTLDTEWHPALNGSVVAIAVDRFDNVYIGGHFSHVDGNYARYLAKLDGTTGAHDTNWLPAPNNYVHALAWDGAGHLYAGGNFLTAFGQPRGYVARFLNGATLDSWSPQADGEVEAIVVSGNSVYIGGSNGSTTHHLAKFDIFNATRDVAWNPAPDGNVRALAADAQGNIFVGGVFDTIGGRTRYSLAKLDGGGTGSADAQWNPAPASLYSVYAMNLNSQGMLNVGGGFYEIGGKSRNNFAQLDSAGIGEVISTLDARPNSSVMATATTRDGGTMIGGWFTQVGNERRDSVAAYPLIPRQGRAQTITFGANPGPLVYGGNGARASATASSALTVRFGSATPTICEVDATGNITVLEAGNCIVTGDQDGDETYAPAPQARQTVRILKAAQAPLTLSATPPIISVNGTSILESQGGSGIGAVRFELAPGTQACSLQDTTVTGLSAGDCSVIAIKAGDHNYDEAESDVLVIRVQPAALQRIFRDGFEDTR